MTDKRELLADYAHASWAGWMRYLFDVSGDFNEDGSFTIEPQYVERWTRQMNTPYTDLPEEEKRSDREEADKIMALLDSGVQLVSNLHS